MREFDAELYLRLLGEDVLLSGEHVHWASPVDEAARALLAVGAIALEDARTILDDYGLASAERQQHGSHWRMHRAAIANTAGAQAADESEDESTRVVLCSRTLENQKERAEIRSVILGEAETTLGVRIREKRSKRSRGGSWTTFGGGAHPWSFGKIADDRGTSATGSFGGSGSNGTWRGWLTLDPPLHPGTAWIEIDGTRLDLAESAATEVRLEEVEEDDPAIGFLWHLLATPTHFHHPREHLEEAIGALVACGAVADDDPRLAEIRAVVAVQQGQASGSRRKLPEPWRSLLGGRARSGPSGFVNAYVATPRIEGTVIEVTGLESTEDGFQLDVMSVGGGGGHPFRSELDETRLAWWAADDQGNRYLGGPGSGGGGGGSWSGTIDFQRPLDPKATRLDVSITGRRHRCTFEIPLVWQAHPDDDENEDVEVFI